MFNQKKDNILAEEMSEFLLNSSKYTDENIELEKIANELIIESAVIFNDIHFLTKSAEAKSVANILFEIKKR